MKHRDRLDAEGNPVFFTFYKNNNIREKWDIDTADLIKKWYEWKEYQIRANPNRGQDWYDYYRGAQCVMSFICDKEAVQGLQSSMFSKIDFEYIRQTIHPHY